MLPSYGSASPSPAAWRVAFGPRRSSQQRTRGVPGEGGASASGASLDPVRTFLVGVLVGVVLSIATTPPTTEENATEVAKLMPQRKLGSAILVTSPWHQRRASIEFSRAFEPHAIKLRNSPARAPQWNAVLWWQHEPMRSQTLLE